MAFLCHFLPLFPSLWIEACTAASKQRAFGEVYLFCPLWTVFETVFSFSSAVVCVNMPRTTPSNTSSRRFDVLSLSDALPISCFFNHKLLLQSPRARLFAVVTISIASLHSQMKHRIAIMAQSGPVPWIWFLFLTQHPTPPYPQVHVAGRMLFDPQLRSKGL